VELSKPVEISSMNRAFAGPTIISPELEKTKKRKHNKSGEKLKVMHSPQLFSILEKIDCK
jgi:hypothetical protein